MFCIHLGFGAVLHDERERSLENHLSSFVPHPYDKGPLVPIREFIARHIRKAPRGHSFGRCEVLKLNSLLVGQEQVAIVGIEEVAGHRHSEAVVLTNSGPKALFTVRQRARTSAGELFQDSRDLPA